MPSRNVLLACGLALILGIALGGSYVAAFLKPFQTPLHHHISDPKQENAETQAADEQEDTNRAITFYALWLVIFTGVLAVATIGLGAATIGLYRTGEKQIGLFGEQIGLARKAFISAHRPRLRVRKVLVHPLNDGVPISLQYEIANIGDTDATLLFAEGRVEVGKGEGHGFGEIEADDPPWFGVGGQIGEGHIIKAGGHLLLQFSTSLHYSWERRFERERMIIRGAVFYRDDNAVERRTEFERFNIAGTRFFGRAKKPDPDYEYED